MTNPTRHVASALVVALALATGAAAQTSLEFAVAGPAPWAVSTNWSPVFVPGDNFPAEIAGISNGGTVTLSAPAPFPVNGVVLGEAGHPTSAPVGVGTMVLSAGGSLNVIAQASQDGTIPAVGTFRVGVGGAGVGHFEMTGGALNVSDAMSSAGAAASSIGLSGNASLSVGSANLQRITRIRGPNVSFESAGRVDIGGTFIPEITAASHSLIDAFGSPVNVSGTIAPEFSGFSPTVGTTWTLAQGSQVSGNFVNAKNVQVTGFTPVAGAKFEAVNSGTTLTLEYASALTLRVDRRTGLAQIVNHIGTITYDGYSIRDSFGNLSPGTWSSLDDQGTSGNSWLESNPTSAAISELNPTSSTSLAPGASNALGRILAPPTEFGQPDPNLVFDYHAANGRTVSGIVDLSGKYNNLVLIVDPATGQAAIQNQSPFGVELDGYSIASASGSLRVAQWNSLDDQNAAGGTFLEANPTTSRLNELNPTSSLALAADSLARSIGSPFNVAGARDLTFTFHLAGGGGGPLGDTNGDGAVNLDDLNNVRNNFGSNGIGDTDGDGDVDLDDLNNVRNNFGASGGGGGPGGTFTGIVQYGAIPEGLAAVPEPTAIGLATVAASALTCIMRCRRRSPE